MLEGLGSQLELGGVAGKFYKNGFLNQDIPFYKSGKINKDKFYNLKINPSNFHSSYFTEIIQESSAQMKERVL